jgi:hypothetical protein
LYVALASPPDLQGQRMAAMVTQALARLSGGYALSFIYQGECQRSSDCRVHKKDTVVAST